jgi:glucose/arabinose dehydrogenase
MKLSQFQACVAALAMLASLASAQTLPSTFFHDTLVPGLNEPVGMAFLPDGRLLIIEQRTAAIKVWTGGVTASLVGTVPGVNSAGNEQGLLGIAVDPNWPARPYVYVWFDSNASPNMRLAMFTVTGDLSNPASTNLVLGAQYNIVTDIPDNASNHNGGSVRFGIDGKLYLSIGDDAGSCNAQNLSSSLGCVWRIEVSGLPGAGAGPPAKATLIPVGNPYAGPTDNARLVWCHGLRNPFRFHIDSVTGYLYIADVGQNAWEEYDEVTAGGQNLGWPWFEGNAAFSSCGGTAPASVPPIATWSHASGAGSIMSLGRYRNSVGGTSSFGAGYEGDCFYLDYYVGSIRRLKHNGVSWITPPAVAGQPNATDWATGFVSLADAAVGSDGAIYYVRQFAPGFAGPGSLGRIRANPNAPQLAVFSGNNQTANPGQTLANPLVVRMTTLSGTPIVGQNVNFVIAAGGGSVNPPSAMTDAQGYAQTSYTLSPTFSAAPAITASSSGVSSVTFNATWRGIAVQYVAFFNYFSLTLRHSQVNSPFTICYETPPAGAPYLATPWGNVWTSVLAPVAGLGYADGLGLFGPADPGFKTGSPVPNWTVTIQPLPSFGGTTFLFQAYAIDTSLLPADSAYMISNTFTVTLN